MWKALLHLRIVKQTTPDHLEKMYMDLNYWSMIMYQERNNNKYFNAELGIICQVADSHLSIIDAGIQLSYLKSTTCSRVCFTQHNYLVCMESPWG